MMLLLKLCSSKVVDVLGLVLAHVLIKPYPHLRDWAAVRGNTSRYNEALRTWYGVANGKSMITILIII